MKRERGEEAYDPTAPSDEDAEDAGASPLKRPRHEEPEDAAAPASAGAAGPQDDNPSPRRAVHPDDDDRDKDMDLPDDDDDDEYDRRRRLAEVEEAAAEAADAVAAASAAARDASAAAVGDEDDDDPIQLPRSRGRADLKKGSECPYLDTIDRHNLDFDFEKCCSVSLSPVNVYACLVCGKYFQGRSMGTHAYTHSLEMNHHMFMKVDNGKVFCLPDAYEVVDRALEDIRYVLNPLPSAAEVVRLDVDVTWARALDGSEYMPGLVGLNNMKRNDYANAVIQMLARITPLRDFFLLPSNTASCSSLLVQRFGELLRKVWNSRNFKGQVSPHEFMQAVMVSSKKRFTIEARSDPVEFWSWLLNELHSGLTDGRLKRPSIITRCFQGEVEVTTLKGTGKGAAASASEDVVERCPFLLLGLDLPAAPLFKDLLEKNIIPQVPIFNIMRKFDGETISDDIRLGRRRFRLTRLPRYMCLHMKRFLKNQFFVEKNPTIVNFPVKNLELRDILTVPNDPATGAPVASKYDLVSNLVQDGKVGEGVNRLHVHRKAEDIWYEVQDLRVIDILPQMVALSEAYFQVYELRQGVAAVPPSPAGGAPAFAAGSKAVQLPASSAAS